MSGCLEGKGPLGWIKRGRPALSVPGGDAKVGNGTPSENLSEPTLNVRPARPGAERTTLPVCLVWFIPWNPLNNAPVKRAIGKKRDGGEDPEGKVHETGDGKGKSTAYELLAILMRRAYRMGHDAGMNADMSGPVPSFLTLAEILDSDKELKKTMLSLEDRMVLKSKNSNVQRKCSFPPDLVRGLNERNRSFFNTALLQACVMQNKAQVAEDFPRRKLPEIFLGASCRRFSSAQVAGDFPQRKFP